MITVFEVIGTCASVVYGFPTPNKDATPNEQQRGARSRQQPRHGQACLSFHGSGSAFVLVVFGPEDSSHNTAEVRSGSNILQLGRWHRNADNQDADLREADDALLKKCWKALFPYAQESDIPLPRLHIVTFDKMHNGDLVLSNSDANLQLSIPLFNRRGFDVINHQAPHVGKRGDSNFKWVDMSWRDELVRQLALRRRVPQRRS